MSHVDLKVVLLGREYSGKTSLVERFVHDRFVGEDKYQNTIGAAYGAKQVDVPDKGSVVMGIWDTAGSERYEAMSRIYYRGARAAIICYDVSNHESWNKLSFWVSEIKQFEANCRLYICANKIDLIKGDNKKRRVDYHNSLDFAEEANAILFETSSKTGVNVEKLFRKIADDYLSDPKNTYTDLAKLSNIEVSHNDGKNSRRETCC